MGSASSGNWHPRASAKTTVESCLKLSADMFPGGILSDRTLRFECDNPFGRNLYVYTSVRQVEELSDPDAHHMPRSATQRGATCAGHE